MSNAWKAALLLAVGLLVSQCPADERNNTLRIRNATVKIQTTYIHPSYYIPWRMLTHASVIGSGAIIKNNLILTNAHVVSDATFIQVMRENDPKKYEATVQFIGHECDLALVKVKDENFFKDTSTLEIGDTVPELKSIVTSYGYPVGGERISITEGVVSRIEIRTYSHSGKSAFLMVQTDAALNPGNSGGPVIQDGKIAGVAFQVRSGVENIGYMIPTPIIKHFLDDVADGTFNGFPDLGVYTDELENDSFREYLGMAESQSGIIVIRVVPNGAGAKVLKEGDVIMKVDGVQVANDGSIPFEYGRIKCTHLIDLKQIGDPIKLTLWRDKKEIEVSLTAALPPVRIPWFKQFETLPRYYIYAGLIFEPLNRDYLGTWRDWFSNADARMLYYFTYLERDRIHPERKEFVIVNSVLPDSENTYLSDLSNRVVSTVNGKTITRLEDVIEAFKTPKGKYHLVMVEGGYKPILLDAARADQATARVLKNYGIPADRRLDQNSGYWKK